MTARGWFLGAARRRGLVEVGVAACVLALPLAAILRPALGLSLISPDLPDPRSRWAVLGVGLVYVGLLGALLGALRLRRAGGGPRQQLGYETAGYAGVVFAVWAGALLAHTAGAVVAQPGSGASGLPGAFDSAFHGALFLAGVSALAAAVAYPLARGAVLTWLVWDRLRRTRLFWALAQAQLAAALLLAVGVAAAWTAADLAAGRYHFGPPFGPEAVPAEAGPAAFVLAWVTTRLLPAATALLVLSLAASVVVLPPAAAISYLALRGTTRRLEGLAAAAEALRAEVSRRRTPAARVAVGGEDEVAQLEVTFNAMTDALARTLRDLAAERDRVAGLLEARRQLVADVSHELRTPVATVRGYLESALRRGASGLESGTDLPAAAQPDAPLRPLPPELRADLATVEREVGRLERLIEDLFTLARAEVGRLELRLEPTDVGAGVGRLVATAAPLAWRQRRVEVLAEVAPDLPPARVDARRLDQVVSNLLGNAVRHTPPGGLVAAVVAAEPAAVRIEVRDTGAGIAPEELPRVFDRFYRGAGGDGTTGAGLGLALAKELAEAMGGSVEAKSVPGEGSCFTVRLPRA